MRILVIIIVVCVASRAFAQTVVQSGSCTGSSVSGVFTTSGCPITGVTAGDTIAACYIGNSGTLLEPVVTETQHSTTVNSRQFMNGNGGQPALGLKQVDITNASQTAYTLSAKFGTGATKATWIWAELSGVIATPFDQVGFLVNGSTISSTMFGATTSGCTESGCILPNGNLASPVEMAVQCGGSVNTQSTFGSATIAGWSVPTNGTELTAPAGLMSTFVTDNTNPVVGTNFATLTHAIYSMSGIVTYIASSQATPTATATATPGTPTPTASPTTTATQTCNPSSTPSPTSTPTATATPATCPVPVVIDFATPVAVATPAMSQTFTYPNAISFGDFLALHASVLGTANSIVSVSDNVNGGWRNDGFCPNPNGDIEDEIWRIGNSASASGGSLTVTVNFVSPLSANLGFFQVTGIPSSGILDQTGLCNYGTDTNLFTGVVDPANTGDFLLGGIAQVGNNVLGSVMPSQPIFQTVAGSTNPVNVPLYVLQNQFDTAQAEIIMAGIPADYAGLLVSYNVCSSVPAGGGGSYVPPAY